MAKKSTAAIGCAFLLGVLVFCCGGLLLLLLGFANSQSERTPEYFTLQQTLDKRIRESEIAEAKIENPNYGNVNDKQTISAIEGRSIISFLKLADQMEGRTSFEKKVDKVGDVYRCRFTIETNETKKAVSVRLRLIDAKARRWEVSSVSIDGREIR